MEIAKIIVGSSSGIARNRKRIPAGAAGLTVSVVFTEPIWDTLTKTVVFRGTGSRIAEFDGKTAVIPWEVLADPGVRVFFGIYGTDSETGLRLPLIEVDIGITERSASPDADPGADPTLPVWAQLQEQIDDLKENGTGGGGGSGSDVLIVTADENMTASHTPAQIKAHVDSGGIVVAKMGDDFGVLSHAGSIAVFAMSGVDGNNNAGMLIAATVNADKSISVETLPILPDFVVTVDENYVASHTEGKIIDQVGLGRRVVLDVGGARYDYANNNAGKAWFHKVAFSSEGVPVEYWAGVDSKKAVTAEAIAYELPMAKENALGGIKAAPATEEMTQEVGITADGKLVTKPGSGSDGNVDHVGVEPAEDDIPKVFFGGALQQTKDEAVVPFRYISKTDDFSGYAEIKAQGNSSMNYPKKNQTVKMFADEACDSKLKKDFKGWGKQNKHVYKANWIDLSHARNVVSARLWADVVKSRANYADLPELFRTTPNQGAVDGFPVKVYAAGVYQGRYTLNIPKDKWTFNMDDELDEHCVLCGENYVSGCFRAAAQINESDWTDEIHDTVPASIKTRWNQVISFVMNSTDDEFRANLSQYFYVDSLIDYYLFGLASCGLDAFGKNQIYATYDGQKWIASMYDMDSTWGLYWNGSKFVSTSYGRNEYEDYVHTDGNLLYNRLEQLFWAELQTRWAELKNGALSIENIINRFERFTDIAPADLVKEDYASTTGGGKFTGIPSQTTNNIQQIRSFALARQAWTDTYIAGLTPEVEVPCTGISLSANTLTFSGEGTQTLTATVTPDGCTDTVTWLSDNTSVATVSGGVVTAIANGSATITAKCGEYSASCSVEVSGIAEPKPCTGIKLDTTYLAMNSEGTYTITATVTPADTTDTVVWVSSNSAVASIVVEDNVCTVQPVSNGDAVITVTCGNYSASCNVSVTMPIGLLYSLPAATTFNGTSDYIDTGIKLFDTPKDFTIICRATFDSYKNQAVIAHCMNEVPPWPGIAIDFNSNALRVAYSGATAGLTSKITDYTAVNTIAVRYVNGVLDKIRYANTSGAISDCEVTTGATYTAVTQNLLLGAYQDTAGTKGRFFTGTISRFDVYNQALPDSDIDARLIAPCTGISLDKTTMSLTGAGAEQTLTATVEPSYTSDAITWESSNGTVAAVHNGRVIALVNGSATITARCGEYSASCEVTVSGVVENDPLYPFVSGTTKLADNAGAQVGLLTVSDGNHINATRSYNWIMVNVGMTSALPEVATRGNNTTNIQNQPTLFSLKAGDIVTVNVKYTESNAHAGDAAVFVVTAGGTNTVSLCPNTVGDIAYTSVWTNDQDVGGIGFYAAGAVGVLDCDVTIYVNGVRYV